MERDKDKVRDRRNPMSNLADSVNRSMVGDLSVFAEGGCLTKIITLVIIVVGLLILSKCTL